MRKIEWELNTGFPDAKHEGTIEVEDNATNEEIDEIVREEAFNYIDWGWKESEGEE